MAPIIHRLLSFLLLAHSTLTLFVAASPHQRHRVLHNHLVSGTDRRASYGSTRLFDAVAFAGTSLSKSCIAALTAPLECSGYILNEDMLYTWSGFSDQNLIPLCTSTCSKSIKSYRSKVVKACASDVYTDPPVKSTGYILGTNVQDDIYSSRASVRPIALADYYLVNYKLLCLKNDESQAFCYSETGNGAQLTASNCTSCILGSMRIQLEDATTFDEELVSQYSSVAKSCKTTVAPVTTPSPVFMDDTSTKTTSTSTCSGSSVAVPTKQSCDDFAFAHNISTSRLLSLNHLIGGCVDWPGESPKLCIQGNCKPYKVKNGDTCRSVARAHGITQTQLTGWNYFIDPYCKNWEQQIGHIICVSDPSGYTPPKKSIPGVGAGTVTAAAPLPTNAQNESNKHCGKWHLPEKGRGCSELVKENGITLDDFLFLNPQINKKCTNMLADTMYCVKAVGDISTYISYHGNTPTPTSTKERKTINLDDLPRATRTRKLSWESLTISTGFPMASGSVQGCKVPFNNDIGNISCEVAVRILGIDLRNWLKWNPGVLDGDGPQAFEPGHCFLQNATQYCGIAYDRSKFPPQKSNKYEPAPNDATANATNKCELWYKLPEDETCKDVLRDFDIPLWALYKWNPSVGSKCEGMEADSSYCIQGPGWKSMSYDDTQTTKTTSPSTATQKTDKTTPAAKQPADSTANTTSKNTATKSTTGPPAPTQSGIVKNCQKWYVTKKGDGCQDIANQFKITLKQFYAWNPAVGTDCKNLWVNEAYCVSAGKR